MKDHQENLTVLVRIGVFLFTGFLGLILFGRLNPPVRAQEGIASSSVPPIKPLPSAEVQSQRCGEIVSVGSSIDRVYTNEDTTFDCYVTVTTDFKGSDWIACGLSINDSWPQNYCPSDKTFKGWYGNKAVFGCTLPRGTVKKEDRVVLVGFDFSPDCGPEKGKEKELTVEEKKNQRGSGNLTPSPNQPKITPIPTLDQVKLLKELIKGLFSIPYIDYNNDSSVPPNQDVPSPPVSEGTLELNSILEEVSLKVNVPEPILEAVLIIESPSVFNFSKEEVTQYSQPGSTIPGCGPNQCSATGPMQMTIGVDDKGSADCPQCCWAGSCRDQKGGCPNAWKRYGEAVVTYGGYSHQPLACNLRDNIYAAAAKLKSDSGASGLSWTKDQVYRAAKRYYGSCSDTARYKRLGNRTYCEFLWWYYNL